MSKSQLVKLPKNPPSKMITKEESVEVATEAYNLRLKGLTYKQIAERVGISEPQAWRRCNIITEYKIKELISKDDHLKTEVNDKLDELFAVWMPLALCKDIALTEEKKAANGQTYMIELPAWEAQSVATKHALDILEKKVRVNGLAPREKAGKQIGADAAGEMAAAFFTAMRNLAGGPKPALQAKVVENE